MHHVRCKEGDNSRSHGRSSDAGSLPKSWCVARLGESRLPHGMQACTTSSGMNGMRANGYGRMD